jgi:hypothetical protein
VQQLAERNVAVVSGTPDRGNRLRAEWDRLMAAHGATEAKCQALVDHDAHDLAVLAAEEEADEVTSRLDDCARRILAEPVHGLADNHLARGSLLLGALDRESDRP